MRSELRVPFAIVMLLTGLLGWSGLAKADCISAPARGAQVLSFTLPANITSPRDAPKGTVLASARSYESHSGGAFCSNGTYTVRNQGLIAGAVLRNGIYVIPNSGIGLRIATPSNGGSISDGSFQTTFSQCTGNDRCNGLYFPVDALVLELIKTEDFIAPAVMLSPQALLRGTVGGAEQIVLRLANGVSFTNATCSVTGSATRNVSLGKVDSRIFNGVGTTSTATPFSLSLNCGGYAGKVSVTFSDTVDSTNRGNVLTLSASPDNATGVGLQLRFGDQIISYGPDSSVAGNVNQFYLFNSSGTESNAGNRSIDFSARYVQTKSIISPGQANARSTLTFSYQ